MTDKKSLSSILFMQLYTFAVIMLYGWFFFKKCLSYQLPYFYIPIAFILVWQALFIIFSLLPTKIQKSTCIILLPLNALVFYFMYAYHTPVDKIMFMNALQTDKAEAAELLNIKVLLFVLVLGIVPAILLWFVEMTPQTFRQKLKYIMMSLMFATALGGLTYPYTNTFMRQFKYLINYLPPINYLSGAGTVLLKELQPHPPLRRISQNIKPQPIGSKPNVIIFIMGETTRAANFSLNGYHRPTNQALEPYLSEIVYYPDVIACGTSTNISVPCIFLPTDRKNYIADSEEYTENVLDIFEQAGYKIRWIDNDGGCKDICNRVRYEEPCDSKVCLDSILLQGLTEKIRSSKENQLIVLHTHGSHGPAYHKHYDEASNFYQPICTNNALWNCDLEGLVNVYDNSVHYVSQFMADTIKILKSLEKEYNTAMFYTSDHGESLGENGVFLHSAPYNDAPHYQKEVPMLVWLPQNNDYKLNLKCLRNKTKQNHSHDNIFHSLLGLGEIYGGGYDAKYDIFSGCRKK